MSDHKNTTEIQDTPPMTKRQIKRAYLKAEIGLSDAILPLMFEHDMMHGEALKFLGL